MPRPAPGEPTLQARAEPPPVRSGGDAGRTGQGAGASALDAVRQFPPGPGTPAISRPSRAQTVGIAGKSHRAGVSWRVGGDCRTSRPRPSDRIDGCARDCRCGDAPGRDEDRSMIGKLPHDTPGARSRTPTLSPRPQTTRERHPLRHRRREPPEHRVHLRLHPLAVRPCGGFSEPALRAIALISRAQSGGGTPDLPEARRCS